MAGLGPGSSPAQRSHGGPAEDIRPTLETFAHLGLGAASAVACLVSWHSFGTEGSVRACAARRWDMALDAVASLLMRQPLNPAEGQPILRLNASALAALCTNAIPSDERIEAAAVMSACESADVTVLILTPLSARTAGELEALLKLITASALSVIVGAEKASSAGFWREHSMSTAQELVKARSELSRVLAEYRDLDDAAAQALRFEARDRFERLGVLIAEAGPFEAWIVAVGRNRALSIAAVSRSIGPVDRSKARRP